VRAYALQSRTFVRASGAALSFAKKMKKAEDIIRRYRNALRALSN
jgi:hypothetical protein